MRRSLLAFLVLSLFAGAAGAVNLADTTVIVPVIGRIPGANGSQWRTDLFLANHSTVDKVVTMTFYVSGGSPVVRTVSLTQFSNTSLLDVVLGTFGLSNAAGSLEMRSSNQSGFEARARIYNSGNAAGQFGQNVPGVGLSQLRVQSFLYGLSGISGSRVNIGVTNPNATTASVTMIIGDATRNPLYSETISIPPHGSVQYNDIFTRFGIAPRADVQIDFDTVDLAIYGWASEVRNDTGDAIFIVGTSPNT